MYISFFFYMCREIDFALFLPIAQREKQQSRVSSALCSGEEKHKVCVVSRLRRQTTCSRLRKYFSIGIKRRRDIRPDLISTEYQKKKRKEKKNVSYDILCPFIPFRPFFFRGTAPPSVLQIRPEQIKGLYTFKLEKIQLRVSSLFLLLLAKKNQVYPV